MTLRLTVVLLLAAAACHKPPKDGGLIADVRFDPAAQVTCVELVISDVDGHALVTQRFPRDGKTELKIGIVQSGDTELPADVKLHVMGLWSLTGCEPAKPNATASDQQAHFTAAVVTQVDFTVRPPGPSDDGDGDGYTGSGAGGPDCDDTQRGTNPGAAEACTMPVDLNCNGRIGCDDAACSNVTCIRPAAALGFASTPQSAEATKCSMAIVVESRDNQGQRTPVAAVTPVTLAEQGALGLQFFSDSGCTLPATALDIPKGMIEVRFFARTATAGTTRLEATAAGFTPAQQDHHVLAGPPASVAFRSAAQTVKSNACSQAVVLEARDMSNNPAPVPGDVAVTLTATPAAGFAFFSDASCSAPLVMPRIMNGAPALTFYFKPTRTPAMVRIDATATGLGMDTQNETVVPGDPASIVFASAAQHVTAGVCSAALNLKLQDVQMTDTTAPMPMSIALAGSGMTFFTASNCNAGSMVSAAAVPTGAGTATVYFIATGAGMPVITASGAGLTLATQTETVDPGAPVKLGFTSGPQGIGTTQCSGPVRLSTLDAFDNPSNVTGAPLAIGLSANPASGFTFHAAAMCMTTAITSTQIPVGANGVTLYFRGNTAGTVVMTADSTLDPDPTQTAMVGVMPPSQLVYLTMPQTHVANECSTAVTLEARDSGGNRSNVGGALAINLAAAPPTGFNFYSDSQCTTQVSQVTMAASSSQVSFYWLGTTAGTVVMTPTSTLPMGPGPQNSVVRAGPPASIVFTTPARTAVAGVCSAALTVQSRDSFGNAAPVTADTALALSAAAGLTYFTDSLCTGATTTSATILSGQSSTTFYAKGNNAPSYNVTAQHASVGMVTQTLTINPAAAAKLVVLTGQQTLLTGQCSSALTFERRDAFDNAITTAAALAVTLTGASGIQFFPASTCTGGTAIGATSIPMGSSTVSVFFKSTLPGTKSVTGTGAAVPTAGTQDEVISLAPPSVMVFSTPAQLNVAAGVVSSPVTLEARDSSGNASPVSADTPISLSALPSTFVYCGDSGCVGMNPTVLFSAGSSSATFYFRGNIAQPFTITATSSLGSVPQGEAVVPAGASELVFTTGAQTRALGSCSLAATVERRDMFGNAVTAGGMLSVGLMASPSAGFLFHPTSACSSLGISSVAIPAGMSQATFFFNGTVPVSVLVTASASGVTQVQQTEVFNAVPPDRMAFVASPTSVTAGGPCSGTFTIEARDPYMNPASVGMNPVLVSLSATAAANATFYSDAACNTMTTTATIPAMGTTASFWLKATGASTMHQVTVLNAALGTKSQTLVVDPGTPAQLQFTTPPLSVRVQGCSTSAAALRVLDANNNVSPLTAMTSFKLDAMPAGGVSFWGDGACNTLPLAVSGLVINGGSSTGSFFIKGGNTIQAVTASVTPVSGPITGTSQSETVTVGAPDKLVFTTAPKSVMAGECSGPLTVQSRDVADNVSPVAGATTVTLTAGAPGGVTFFNDSNCTSSGAVSIAAGASQVSFSAKGITGGAPVMNAAGAGIPNAGTQALTVAPMVRSGQCTITNGSTNTPCPISPALNPDPAKTFFLFQATSLTNSIDDTAVRCALTNATTLTCSRGGNAGDVTVRWYTVSRATGLSVQHFPNVSSMSGGNAVTTLGISPVNPAQTFVLMSTSTQATSMQFNETRWSSVRLLSASSVEIRRRSQPDTDLTHSVQVVEWTGAVVERSSTQVTMADNAFSATATLPSTTDPAFVLHSWRYNQASTGREICRLAVRSAITAATTVTFTRGAGSATVACGDKALDIELERVRMPGHRIEAPIVSMAPTILDATPTAIPNGTVDLTRTVAFFGATTFGGQSMGESSDLQADRFRDSLARASFINDSTVQVSRAELGATGTTASQWTLLIWQLVP